MEWFGVDRLGSARGWGAGPIGGKLYAAGGGNDDDVYLSSAEVFDPQTQTWAPIAPMNTERKFVMVAAVQGKLYAAGGDDDNGSTLTSAEAYDPQQNRWEALAAMASTHDRGCAVAM